jgi:hypothetical protein
MSSTHVRFVGRYQALETRYSCHKTPVECNRTVLVRCQRPDLAEAWRQNGDEWCDTEEDDANEYFDNSFSSAGYEAAATALTLAAGAALLKLLWYLAIVCWALVSTAFQYSVVAIALIIVVVFLG